MSALLLRWPWQQITTLRELGLSSHQPAKDTPSDVVTEETVREVFGISSKVVPDPVSGAPLVMPIGRHRVKRE